MSKARGLLGRVQDKRKRRLLAVVNHGFMDRTVAHEVVKLLRRMDDITSLDVILESGGGDLDAAYKTLKIIKSYAKDTTVIVPFYAKSAATLIALGGDSLILCKGGELGPMDPQVLDIRTKYYVPANSIKETVDFLGSLDDQVVKITLTDKIPTLMVGAYKAAAKSSRQYLEEVIKNRNLSNAKALIDTFTEKFFSHGYPMDAAFLKENGIDVSEIDYETESLVYEMMDQYTEAEQANDGRGGVTIIHSDVGYTVIREDGDVVRKIYKERPGSRT